MIPYAVDRQARPLTRLRPLVKERRRTILQLVPGAIPVPFVAYFNRERIPRWYSGP